ncbi:MAG: cofactor-independent phosphoglycerate mutase [Paludibacteraceae bacterium]|nr:cofactor-independent phosphoglycerate mutase [Paludibacteraceae bacterium]MCR5569912.1 cofactor-independent phosphoglycerate mutase [Paludibacteraceae bacterium]
MKYIIILGDGMADDPIPALGNKTILQAANKPVIDYLAKNGRCGMLETVPDGFHPGSEIANLQVLGYDVRKVFEGRGSLECAGAGVPIYDGEMVMRCNLICIADGKIKNHSAGHISSEEAYELLDALNKELGDDVVSFHRGIQYRHILKVKNGNKFVSCTPPHDVPGTPFRDVMVKADKPEAEETAQLLNDLILRSQKVLENHPVNLKRKAEGKDPANSIWPWSAGYKPSMKTLKEMFGVNSGVVITAVDLIKGIGVLAGLKPVEVEGATGLFDTNYEGKAQAAIEALKHNDFVYLHIEASDEAGHEGNVDLKLKTVEYLENRAVKPIFEEVSKWDEPVTIAVLPDHPTPCWLKTHVARPIPFLIYYPGQEPDAVQVYDEEACKAGAYGLLTGDEFMRAVLGQLKK